MIIEGKVGPQPSADGVLGPARIGRTGELIVGSAHGDFYEAVARQGVFSICNAVAGVAPGTALSTTPPIALWNPPGSGVNLALVKAVMSYISGTFGAGSVAFALVAQQATQPTGGTALTAQSNLIGSTKTPLGKGFTGSTLAATPTILRPFASFGPYLATTVLQERTCETINDGAIVIAPGGVLCMQGIATAGTTPLALFGMVWEEIPIIGS
jgi:hypothetical protein